MTRITVDRARTRAQDSIAAVELDGIRLQLVRLIAEHPDGPPDALLRLVDVADDLERAAERFAEVGAR